MPSRSLFRDVLACAAALLLMPAGPAPLAAADDAPPRLSAAWRNDVLTIRGPGLPGGELKVQYLEAFCRAGSTDRDWSQTVIPHSTRLVAADVDGRRIDLVSRLADGVEVTHAITVGNDEVDFRLVATNATSVDSEVHWAQPCLRVAGFAGAGFGDAAAPAPKYLRQCFVCIDGQPVRLPTEPWATKARYTPGQVYCPRHVDRRDVNPRPLSSLVPSCGLAGCYSADGRRIVATAWEPYQEVFQGVLGCLHCDFRIGGLKAGQQKQVRGKIYLVAADLEKLSARWAADFPQQAGGVHALRGAVNGGGPVDNAGRPRIEKLGTIALHMVETTPIVFRDRLYRFEWVRGNDPTNAFLNPDNKQGQDHFHFVDVATGKATEPFAIGYRFGSAFVDGDTVYVTGSGNEGGWYGRHVRIFASKDLRQWESWLAIPPPKYGLCNTSIAKAGDKYVMMFEIWLPKEEAGEKFTARFATSPDLRRWTITPPECVYAKDRYTAPHCLRYLGGWYYDFYLERNRGYETRVVRSRDLIHWESSPLNPVLRFSDEDKKIANDKLTPPQRAAIARAKNLNNSDIDFCQHQGKLVIYYSWGDQLGTEFLAEARYDGTQDQFLRGWFPPEKKQQ